MLSTPHDLEGLAPGIACSFKLFWRSGIELKHLKVVWDGQPGMAGLCQRRCFCSVEIARHAAFGPVAVDRQEHHIAAPGGESWDQPVVHQCIAAVVKGEAAAFDDEAEVLAASLIIALDFVVGCSKPGDLPAIELKGGAIVNAGQKDRRFAEALTGLRFHSRRQHERNTLRRSGEGQQGGFIKVVRVLVTGRDGLHKVQLLRSDAA